MEQPRVSWSYPTSEDSASGGDALTVSLLRDVMVVEDGALRWTEPYARMVQLKEYRDTLIIRRDRERVWTLPKAGMPEEALRILRHEFARKYKKAWWGR